MEISRCFILHRTTSADPLPHAPGNPLRALTKHAPYKSPGVCPAAALTATHGPSTGKGRRRLATRLQHGSIDASRP